MSKYEIENVKLTAPKLDRKDLEYAMTYRYACKKFDSTKKISDDDWNAILNAGKHFCDSKRETVYDSGN